MDTTKINSIRTGGWGWHQRVKQLLNGKIDNATVTQLIEQAKTAVKNDILGRRRIRGLEYPQEEIAEENRKHEWWYWCSPFKKLADLGIVLTNS